MPDLYIFQSYSHADWEPVGSFSVSRLSEFVSVVQQTVGTSNARSDFRWMRDKDGRIRYSDNIDETLENAIADCAIGVIVLSKSYVMSDSTTKEFDALRASGKPLFVIGLEDIHPSVLESCGWSERAREIEKFLSCRLYIDDPSAPERAKLLGYPIPEFDTENVKEFYDLARNFGTDIVSKGREIMEAAPAGDSSNGDDPDGPGDTEDELQLDVVILATPPDDTDFVNQLTTLLYENKIKVRTLSIEGLTGESVGAAIRSAKVVAQVLGRTAGREVEGLPAARFQHDQANKLGKAPITWLAPNARSVEDLDPGYRDFVKSIEVDTRAIDNFAISVMNRVKQIRAQETFAEELGGHGAEPFIVIDSHPEDFEIGKIFSDALASLEDERPIVTFVEKGAKSLMRTMKMLESSRVHSVLVLYGPSDAGRERLTERLTYYHQPIALRRKLHKQQDGALTVADPDSPGAPPGPRGRGIYTLKLQDNELPHEDAVDFIRKVQRIANATVDAAAAQPAE